MPLNPKCDPLVNNVNSPIGPPLPGLPGFTYDINIPTIPMPDLDGIPEDILNLLRRLKLKLPGGGLLQDLVDSLAKTVAKILSSLLGYLNAFLGIYFFVLALIELILCVIKVLCAFPKPWSVIRAVKRLLRKCIPLFIQICFPFFALLLLLLNLIAILIALIEYIIQMILRLIKQLLKNLKKLYNITIRQYNPNAALAIISKLANLLCLFEQIFTFLGAVFSILELITSIWDKSLKVCSGGGGSGTRGPDDDDVCAPFMKNPIVQTNDNIEIWKSRVGSAVGELWFCNEVYGIPFPPGIFPAGTMTKLRNEVIYFKDDALIEELKFYNMITYGGFPFFPFDSTITKDTEYSLKPYFLDMTITCDPLDGYGSRAISFEDVTVTYVATEATATVVASVPTNVTDANGFLSLSGGTVINDVNLNGQTIDYVVGQRANTASGRFNPSITGSGSYVSITNITYDLKVNYEALAQYTLITMSCLPSVEVEQNFLNVTFDKAFNFTLPDFVTLPDIEGASNDLQKCMSDYRTNITIDTTEVFGNCMTNIMDKLYIQASNTYCQLLQASLDVYNMQKAIVPDLQFIKNPIDITITPKDQNGRTLLDLIGGFTPPASCMNNLADKFKGEATLGSVSKFSYDGYGNFIAELTSDIGGDGLLSLYFDDNLIVTAIRPDDPSVKPQINSTPISYTFIDATGIMFVDGYGSVDGYGKGMLPSSRRNETDAANR